MCVYLKTFVIFVVILVQVLSQEIPHDEVENRGSIIKESMDGSLNTVPFTSTQGGNSEYEGEGGMRENHGGEREEEEEEIRDNRRGRGGGGGGGGGGLVNERRENRQRQSRPLQQRRQNIGRQRQYATRQFGERRSGEARQFPDNIQTPNTDTTVNSDTTDELLQDPNISRQPLGAIILLLQRLSDRLVSLETLQRQQAERTDTINYRLTRIELQAEERKGVVSELSNSLKHRMETTDSALDTVTTHLDDITTSIQGITQRQTDIMNTVNQIPKDQGDGGSDSTGRKLQAVMATIHGVRSATQAVKDEVLHLAQNLTMLTNITENLDMMSEKMVTKQYLHENLNELQNTDTTSLSMLASNMFSQSRSSRRRGGPQRQQDREAEDCWEVQERGNSESGVYRIQPQFSSIPFFVYCDMQTDGGGWTVIQRREDGTVDFLRDWHDYKYGFGNLAGEFWLGNEKIHMLTNQYVSQLRVDLADFDQQKGYAVYSAFAMGSQQERYSLKMLGEYMGDVGDSLRYHVGQSWSTYDIDNDGWGDRNCARDHHGAWWYRACDTSNLNGLYLRGPLTADRQYTGLYWYDFRGHQYSLWHSKMMVRRGGSVSKPVFKNITQLDLTPTQRPGNENGVTLYPEQDVNPRHNPYATYDYPYY